MRLRPTLARHIAGAALPLWAFLAVGTAGCHSFAPNALPSVTASKSEKKIAKQAASDPFPSPADVGLTAASPPQD